ncbi:MAG: biotin--[acetyl-CoA-carboxylase] ligase [Candidatus Omnitrophota bacterium]
MIDNNILDVLRGGGMYVSGEELCKVSGVSRAAIWKRIEKLREEGYDIEATPHLGYRLIGIPDLLIPSEIKWNLGTKRIGKEVISYRKVDSTNDAAYELAEHGIAEGAVVFAEEQARGKGRHGRTWQSPPGAGIYMSCVLRPEMAPNEIPKITLIAAVATARAIREFSGADAKIKWPNDIVINGRKVCGILTEMKAEQDRIDFIILGIGINVNAKAKELPKGATSLKEELRSPGGADVISRVALAKKVLETIERYYNILKNKGSGSIIEEWRELSAMLGSRVRVVLHDRTFDAHAHDIDPDGALVVRLDSGIREKISSGDVVMLR